jgi:hypothetical protein
MSHFTVLVTGTEVHEALAPFIEQQEEGYEQYFKFVPDLSHDEMVAEFEKYNANEEHENKYDSVEEYADDYHGYKREGDSWGYVRNPNAKWDWYELGGRWSGMLKLKQGEPGLKGGQYSRGNINEVIDYADSALKGSIDWDGMRAEERIKALEYANKILPVLVGLPMHINWEEMREVHHKDNIDDARTAYRDQPSVKAVNALEGWHSIEDILDVCSSFKQIKEQPVFTQQHIDDLTEEYGQYRSGTAGQTFAVLHEGQWIERGEMGWWGIAHNEEDPHLWSKKMSEFIDNLPDDTIISIVDCHI